MAPISRLCLRRLELLLHRPYRLSYRTFETFEPYVVEVQDADGRVGFADAHISPGSSSETREGGWAFLCARLAESVGLEPQAAKAAALEHFSESKVATTALVSALEVLENNRLLEFPRPVTLPLLTPINGLREDEIRTEVEEWLDQGFRTFKVKVGKDVAGDLERVAVIQDAVGGRATLRLDANRAYSREQGVEFARQLNPENIALFEQPCDSGDWEANEAVADASTVPLMLDEPICTLEDIERAAGIANVRFCKLKLKRFGGLERLEAGLRAVRSGGMEPVLGDGLGSDIHAWLEACVARETIRNAGEFNGFLKSRESLLVEPLRFEAGSIHIPGGYRPTLDREVLERVTVESRHFH
ncbi:MAG: mandelate racemase/muconate lactonizing enzyme family protein [Mesorhizobium sp.]